MGKETVGPRRTFEYLKNPISHPYKQNIQWIFAKQWTNTTLTTVNEVSEDAKIQVVINDGFSATNIVCKGMKMHGNCFGDLFKKLKERKVMPRNLSNVEFFIKRGMIWEKINEAVERFDSGTI